MDGRGRRRGGQGGTEAGRGAALRRLVPRLAPTLFALALLGWSPLGHQVVLAAPRAQTTATAPADTFRDDHARALLARARAAQGEAAAGIRSYEATLTERVSVSMGGQAFRRDRTLLEQDRVARIRWSRDEPGQVRWLGVRRRGPVEVSIATSGDAAEAGGEPAETEGAAAPVEREDPDDAGERIEVQAGSRERAGMESGPGILRWNPQDDRLVFGGGWALNPLADTAGLHYRYSSGDTLRISVPGRSDAVVLLELLVEPRRESFNLVSASLWFQEETGHLARAHYRPSRPFSLRTDGSGEDDVPFWFPEVEGEIHSVSVDYFLQDFQWWVPRSFAFQGEGRFGRILRVPVTVEWLLGDFRVNEAAMSLPGPDDPLPAGGRLYTRRSGLRTAEDTLSVVSYQPSRDSLLTHPALPAPREALLAGVDDRDLRDLEARLRELAPVPRALRGAWIRSVPGGLARYNRVEGLALAGGGELSLPWRWRAEGVARVGFAEQSLRGELSLVGPRREGPWRVTAFRRLEGVSDWDDPFSLSASAAALLLGRDRVTYFEAMGAEVTRTGGRAPLLWTTRIFREEHRSVPRTAAFHFLRPLDRPDFPENPEVERLGLFGAGGELRAWHDRGPGRTVLSLRAWSEVAGGDARYVRIAGSGAASRPLAPFLAGALEAGAGTLLGESPPIQKHFWIGGSETLRGFRRESFGGPAFWFARGELGSALPAARLVAFGDLGWAGEREEWTRSRPWSSAGVGLSFLEGLLRLEAAHPLRGEGGTRFHFYADALF